MKNTMKAVLTAVLFAVVGGIANAVPLTTPIQGTLTDPSGNPYLSQQSVEFKVFQGGQAGLAGTGTLVYDETATITPQASGVFNYLLGTGTPTQPTLTVNGLAQANVLSTATYNTALNVYVEIAVGGNTVLPRLQLAAVPYAVISAMAQNLAPGAVLQTTGINAAWARFISTDTSIPSIVTSTNINAGGGVTAPWFSGQFIGDGSLIKNVSASNVAAANVTPGTFGAGVVLPTSNLTGGPLAANLFPAFIAVTTATNYFTAHQQFGAGLTANMANLGGDGVWNAAGSVGIGTTSPKARLDINGGAIIRSSMTWQGLESEPAEPPAGFGAMYYDTVQEQFMINEGGTGWYPLDGEITNVSGWTAAGPLTYTGGSALVQSTMTVQGPQFSVGGNGFVVNNGAASVANQLTAASVAVTASAAVTPAANTITKENVGKAWVTFDGSLASCPTVGSQCAIKGGFNVASVTRASTGSYTIAWKTPFADTNYMPAGSCLRTDSNASIAFQLRRGATGAPFTTTTALVGCGNFDGYPIDGDIVGVQVMGNQ